MDIDRISTVDDLKEALKEHRAQIDALNKSREADWTSRYSGTQSSAGFSVTGAAKFKPRIKRAASKNLEKIKDGGG